MDGRDPRRDGLGELGVHLLHDGAGVAGDAVGVGVVAAEFLGVDVDLDDALTVQPGGEGQAGADGEDDVEVRLGLGDGVVAQAQRAQGQRVAVVDGALALGGGDDGSLQPLGEAHQWLRSLGGDDAAAGPDEGTARAGQDAGGLGDLLVGCRGTRVAFGLDQRDRARVGHGLGRHLDLHGTGPAGLELAECLVDGLGGFLGGHDAADVLGDGADGVLLVVDLVEHATVHADEVALDLAADDEDGRGRGVGGAESGGCVEQAGSGDHEGGADLSAGAGVAVGHVGGGLLVAGGDEPDAGHVVERIEGMVELHAGESENHADAFEVQRTHQGLAAGHRGHNNTFLGSFPWFGPPMDRRSGGQPTIAYGAGAVI